MGEDSAIAPAANQYDVATKRIVNRNPTLLGRVFGIDVPQRRETGPTELNLAEVHVDRRNADMVITGDDLVVHLEFQRRADPAMADRMLIYRSLLRVEPACSGKSIKQHVIVLGQGTSPSRIDEPPNLLYRFETHYARDLDPAVALGDPLTAPWAMLAPVHDDDGQMARLADVVRIVQSAGSESLVRDLISTTLDFAAVVMKREDIERALREAGMPNYKGEMTWEDELIDEGRVESIRNSAIQLLTHRGVEHTEAGLIAGHLLDRDRTSAVEQAAFGDLGELKALIARK